jgi:hypothetical protein
MTWWCRRFDVAISDKGATAGKSGATETHLTLSTFTTIEEEDEEDRQRGTSIQEQDGEGWRIGTMSKKQGRSAHRPILVGFLIMRSFQPRHLLTRCAGTFRSSPVGHARQEWLQFVGYGDEDVHRNWRRQDSMYRRTSERGGSTIPSGAGISCFRLPITLSLHAGTSSHSPFSRLLLSCFSHRYFLITAVLTNSIDTPQQRHQTSQAAELPR